MKKCANKFCRGTVTKAQKSSLCGKCRSRRFKERHPLKFSFQKLRWRAKERGHSFSLTFEQYEKFAIDSGYAQFKGKTKHCLSINRKDPTKGYHMDNIECVTVSMNSRLNYVNIPDHIKEEMVAEATRQLQEQGCE